MQMIRLFCYSISYAEAKPLVSDITVVEGSFWLLTITTSEYIECLKGLSFLLFIINLFPPALLYIFTRSVQFKL